jgi:hypothetical protein
VTFLGLTTFLVDKIGNISTCDEGDDHRNLFLVFERASEGNLLDFEGKHLEGCKGQLDQWSFIVDSLGCIASGLHSVHERNIIHG